MAAYCSAIAAYCRSSALAAPLRQLSAMDCDMGSGKMSSSPSSLDARRPSALSRALGVTPQQVTTGLSAAQWLPALPGAILGIPLAIGLDAAVSSGQPLPIPPAWQLLAVVLATLLVVAGLTAIPARIAARRPAAEILQSELA
jgi:putative ABC transport system permease protein